MRSSIACARCRRSKVKCVNNGVNTTCRACEASGKECVYSAPSIGSSARRESRNSNPASAPNSEPAPKRQPRPKKPATPANGHPASGTSVKESPRAIVDALDNALLTPQVWKELFDIFQLHYSTDLPFLHPPTFLKPLSQPSFAPQIDQSERQGKLPTPNASPLLLLAFLSLTSRFHPGLVAYHSPPTSTRPSNPSVAAQYYATAAKARLAGSSGDQLGTPTLERTQAILMLALHDWGNCRGTKAWISSGVAVRSAQILGLQFERDLDDLPLSRAVPVSTEAKHMGLNAPLWEKKLKGAKADDPVEQEIKRRTFWSCFVLDRYLSSGKYRPQMLSVEDLRVQLPSSDQAFLFGEKVRTLLLGERRDEREGRAELQRKRKASFLHGNGEGGAVRNPGEQTTVESEHVRWEIGPHEGLLSCYIKALDIYGRIVKWSCGGGRRAEDYPPWDSRSTFFELDRLLTSFRDSLPRAMELTAGNTSAHVTSRTSTPYSLMHTLLLLCRILLLREYLPFIALKCHKPEGPIDPPLFPPDQYQTPPGFWDRSAQDCFKAARDLVNLLTICQEWDMLAQTPVVGFAAYIAAIVGVYCINFPWMDSNGYMWSKSTSRAIDSQDEMAVDGDSSGTDATRKALEIVGQMRSRLAMAEGWFRTVRRVQTYYGRVKKDFRRSSRSYASSHAESASPGPYKHTHTREDGLTERSEDIEIIEKVFKRFGGLDDGPDVEMPDAETPQRNSTAYSYDGRSEVGSTAMRSDAMDVPDNETPVSDQLRHERWNAINTVAAAAASHHAQQDPNRGGRSPYLSSDRNTPRQSSGGTTLPPLHQVCQTSMYAHQQQLYNPPNYPANPYAPSTTPDPGQYAPPTPQQPRSQYHERPPHHQRPWSPQARDAWLDGLETSFGGDDVAAFVAGSSWENWPTLLAGGGETGWLGVVWGVVT